MPLGGVSADELALLRKEVWGVLEWAQAKSPRPALGICDLLTPTPSALPYGYSMCAGGANVGAGCVEMVAVDCWAEGLGGSEGASRWL